MKRQTRNIISLVFYMVLGYFVANTLLIKLNLPEFETLLFQTDFGPFMVRHLIVWLVACGVSAFLTLLDKSYNAFIPIFSIIVACVFGMAFLLCYAENITLNKWFLIFTLLGSSMVLEVLCGTVTPLDIVEDFAFSYTLIGLYLELLTLLNFNLLSFEAFIIAAFLGAIQVVLATNCHTLPEQPLFAIFR